MPGRLIQADAAIADLLRSSHTIAVLGLSPKVDRDSYRVADYLKQQGYRIIPVRPGQKEILGEKVYASLAEIPVPVDIVDVFRNSAQVLPHAHEALGLRPKAFWMQLGIVSQEAADLLTASGIDVVMDRCIKIEHAKHRN